MSELHPDQPFFPALIGLVAVIGASLTWPYSSLYAQSASGDIEIADHSDCQEAKPSGNATVSNKPIYKPPRRGAPKTRVGGGTRNRDSSAPSIELIAPVSTGHTTQAMPTLFWHLSDHYDGTYEFVVIERDSSQPEPLFRKRMSKSLCAGFHKMDLSELEIELVTGVIYQWSIAIVLDTERRSHDIVAQATLERVDIPDDFQQTPQYLAHKGYWYDVIEATDPTNASATNRAQIHSLLQQVGLGDLSEN